MLLAALRRLAIAVPTVLLVLALTFTALQLAPGDPVRLFLGPGADAAAAGELRRQLGLDQPLPVQFAHWLGAFLTGDWGTSIAQQRPVTAVLREALGPTIALTGLSLLLSYIGGAAIGLVQAARSRSRTDVLLTALTSVLQALPSYVLALALVLLFAYWTALLGLPEPLRLPAIGAEGISADLLDPWSRVVDRIRHAALPVTTLALIGAAGTARYVRAVTADIARQPFVRAARSRGLGERSVLVRHALRIALLPLVTLAGLQLPALFSGVVFVEAIFAWPGMGRVAVGAVLARDIPVVLAVTAVFAMLVVLGNLLADMAAWLLDPRTRGRA